MQTCKDCNIEKDLSCYYRYTSKSGTKRYRLTCKECCQLMAREKYSENPEKYRKPSTDENRIKAKERSKKYYSSIHGRASTLLKGVNDRDKSHQLDIDWFVEKLNKGICEVTGLKFDFEPHPIYGKNPMAPSVDRIDSSIGYTKENSRLVIWQYNMGKAETTDEEFYQFCLSVVNSKRS